MEYKLAAIDLGSNGLRLQVNDIINPFKSSVLFHTVDLFRLPIRLGEDVFETQKVSDEKKEMLIKAFVAFKNIMDIHHVQHCRACTTSAMRDAQNSAEIITAIKAATGIHLEIIDGIKEAKYILNSQDEAFLEDGKAYLFIDVGGGSTQVSVIFNGEVLYSHSYQMGTVRMLNKMVEEPYWRGFKADMKNLAAKYKLECIVGSGGNINRIHKLLNGKKDDKFVDKKALENVYQALKGMTIEERIEKYKFNKDRADVIVPAAKIYVHALRATELSEILVPRVTLLDGIIRHLYLDLAASI